MTVSPYITESLKRAALPIRVAHGGEEFVISSHCYVWFPVSPWGAHSTYRYLVESLSTPATSRAGSAADCSALSSPGVR